MDDITNKDLLEELINNFYDEKLRADHFKKMADDYNKTIKELLIKFDIHEFETTSGLVAKLSVQRRESFIEDKLIEKLTELGHNEVIDLVPKINYDKLEDIIYNGKLDASVLSEFKTVKEIPTLKVTAKK